MFLANLHAGLDLGVLLTLIAIGYSLVLGVLRFVNFAHGDFMAAGGYALYAFHRQLGLPFHLSVLLALVTAGLLGMASEKLVFRRVRHRRLALFLSSFGLSLVCNAIVTLLYGGTSRTLVSHPTLAASSATRWGFSWVALVAFLLVAVTWFLVRRTNLGLAVRAISEDSELVETMGVPVNRVISWVFFASAAMAAAAGMLLADRFGLTPEMGSKYSVWSFAAVVIAGYGSIPGLVLTCLVMGVCLAMTVGVTGSYVQGNALMLVLMSGFLLLRPEGLFGTRLRRM